MENRPKVLDLFSGIGGFSLGLERAGFETVAFCEIEPFCRQVLHKHWPDVPVFEDIRNLDGQAFNGKVDVICGGFPCQPFSVAGRKKGTQDDRDLWPEMFRVIQQTQPRWIIGENVAHFTNVAFARTKADLESAGYTVQPFIIPACAVGAPHRRDRVWILGYAEHDGQPASPQQSGAGQTDEWPTQGAKEECQSKGSAGVRDVLPNPNHQRCQGSQQQSLSWKPHQPWEFAGGYSGWRSGWPISKPRVCGVDDGIPDRTHRLRGLGNAVVPQIPELIGRAILNTMMR